MVQLLVKFSPDGVSEWGLIELQGELETRDQISFDNMHIGDLHFDDRGTPHMIVGHHLLTGKVETLEKPFAVLKKNSKLNPQDSDQDGMGLDQIDVDQSRTETGAKKSTEYVVVAMVTRKIIFKNRPKPIITKTLSKKQ